MAEFFNNSIEGFNEVLKAIKAVKKELIDVAKINQKAVSGINPAKAKTEDINKLAVAEKALVATEKELIKVSKEELIYAEKIAFAQSEQGKIRAENKLILSEANKTAKDAAKISLGLSNAYQKESKQLNDLRNKFKNLSLGTAAQRKEAQKLLPAITKLDTKLKAIDKSVGQNFRSVGDYKGAIGDLTPVLGSFGSKLNSIQAGLAGAKAGFLKMAGAQDGAAKSSKALRFAMIAIPIFAIVAAITALIGVFAGTQRGMDAITKVTRPLAALFDKLLGSVQDLTFWLADKLGAAFDNPMQAMKDLGDAILENVINRFKSFLVLGEAISLLMDGEFALAAKKGTDAMIQMSTGITDATDKIVEAGEAISDFVDESIVAGLELDALIKRFERLELASIVPLQRMKLEYQKLKEIANDQLKTDEERIEALLKAEQIQKNISNTEGKLLQLRIDRMVKEQSLNDTTREDKKELQQLIAEQLVFETTAQKKISGIVSLRTGIELRMLKERFKAAQDFDALFKESTDKAVENERALVSKIADVNNDALDAKDKAYAESIENRMAEEMAFAKMVTSETGKEIDARLKLKEDSLKKEQTDIEKSISIQQGLADKGLENSLAFEEEALAKNQLEIIENEKKAANIKEAIRLGELFLTLKEAEAQERVQGSTSRALAGVAESKAITAGIKATVNAFEKGGLVEGDEQLIRINEKGQEFVIDAPTTAALGLGKSGSNMGDFNNMLSMHEMNKSDRVVQDKDGNYKVIEAVKNLNETLKNKPEHFIDLDKFGNIISEIKKGGKTERVFRKTNSRL
mgnify:CR=1 FL=1